MFSEADINSIFEDGVVLYPSLSQIPTEQRLIRLMQANNTLDSQTPTLPSNKRGVVGQTPTEITYNYKLALIYCLDMVQSASQPATGAIKSKKIGDLQVQYDTSAVITQQGANSQTLLTEMLSQYQLHIYL